MYVPYKNVFSFRRRCINEPIQLGGARETGGPLFFTMREKFLLILAPAQ